MNKKDILIFMSDQHTPLYTSMFNDAVKTPNMTRLCRQGVNFTEAYTACPLCVPARASMLTALRPGRTGIFTLEDAIADTTPTFLHNLVEAGYETVLCGRMHFVGKDQRHGFTKRIGQDMTPVTWSRPVEKLKKERGVFARTFAGTWTTQVIGGGESPVLHYDEEIINLALDYLSQDHEKPQCIVVSIYAPHFPYVASKELFQKYYDRVEISKAFYMEETHPLLKKYSQQETDEVTARGALAAYFGMIEKVDAYLGRIWEAFATSCSRRKTEGIICYTSDHGDQCGDRKMFGKETFYEKSVKIPLIFSGSGIKEKITCDTPVSIMDIGPTLLDLAGADGMLDVDGVSLVNALEGKELSPHDVYSEFLERTDGGPTHGIRKNAEYSYGLMLRKDDYKYVTYTGYEQYDFLFDIKKDPEEANNLADTEADIVSSMRDMASKLSLAGQAIRLQKNHDRAAELFVAMEKALGGADESERWNKNPPSARKNPDICVKGL